MPDTPPRKTPKDNPQDDLSALSDLAAEVIGDDGIYIPTEEDARFRRPTTPPAERYPPLLDDYSPPPDETTTSLTRPTTQASRPAPKSSQNGCLYNLLTLMFLAGTVGLMGYFYIVWQNPYSVLNPLAPPTPFIEVTATPDVVAQATAQAEATLAVIRPTAQALVDLPTRTPEPEVTLEVTPTPANTPRPEFVFTLREPGVTYSGNQNQRGCNWASIRGTVYGLNDEPLDGYRIRIIDTEDPARLDVSVSSGVLPDLGPGVYEQLLGSTPRERRYTIQLYDSRGLAVSEPFLIFTREACTENVAQIDFEQVR